MAKEKEFEQTKSNSSIDVDSVWASMKTVSKSPAVSAKPKVSTTVVISDSTSTPPDSLKDEYVTIKRSYNFAGKVTTEEKKVLASSAEGKAYISQQQPETNKTPLGDDTKKRSTAPVKKRPVKRRKSSMMEELARGKAPKLNTLEKSRMDWLGYVDQEGLKDDLSQHNKDGYLNKQDFLMRVERRIDDDWKQAKKK